MLKLNCENPILAVQEPMFGAVIDRFIEEERLLEIKKQRPGEHSDHGLSYGTVSSYLSVLKHIRAKWGATRLNRVKAMAYRSG